MRTRKRKVSLAVALIVVLAGLIVVGANQTYQRLSARPQAPPAATRLPTATTSSQLPSPTQIPTQIGAKSTEVSESMNSATRDSWDIAPYPDAPNCPDSAESHDNSLFHALWDGERGCHYDHEHGQFPFTPEVAATFPDFDLRLLLGEVGVGHTNPSSEMENTHKHGGFKWDVTLSHSAGCAGREVAPTGVDALVAQYHAFGNYSIEFESRIHSAVALMRQCQAGNPSDYGYVFAIQHQDYGQRVAPYQGRAMPYPDTPDPAFDPAREPYFSVDCFGGVPPCDKYPTLDFIVSHNASTDSTWISEPVNITGSGSPLFSLLFRLRDTYQALDWSDQSHPFTFAWICSRDGGASYSGAAGCRYNNSTTRVHEVIGEIPPAWDNMAGFDRDARVGRVTAEGFVTRFGELNPACTAPGPDCHPLKLIQAFTGRYGSSFLLNSGTSSFSSENLPERDIYFCGGQVCAEGDPGAMPSGWIGPNN